jgi:hypothetical protein
MRGLTRPKGAKATGEKENVVLNWSCRMLAFIRNNLEDVRRYKEIIVKCI